MTESQNSEAKTSEKAATKQKVQAGNAHDAMRSAADVTAPRVCNFSQYLPIGGARSLQSSKGRFWTDRPLRSV